ncbi:N-acetylmuramate alpha-1-phosphate uridylyltransferase MurU [Thalassotalea marina]|uniref:Mannose-1-phosphate guanylyltransferase n=1 Tax=Thalassotalea marina TaxID=1673741 RepID=A0A919EHD4_9GAMM|nr:nucleotidyltransferase family protein [Thalassotalea marina]GHF78428.1 mannose-1-phosphate guanylyltransferase [Thalassotalea marina]
MKAMILAAGRGERMRPLTDDKPKPMLTVNGIPLIEHHIRRLKHAGITELVINTAWQAQSIENYLQDGSAFGVSITYSHEREGALETAGGIATALPLFATNDEPFLLVNGDVFTDIDFCHLPKLAPQVLAHLFLVPNPEHNPNGDFCLSKEWVCANTDNMASYTYSGVSIFRPSFFDSCQPHHKAALGPLLKRHLGKNQIAGQLWQGLWTDVGTPERLASLQTDHKAETQ